MIQPCTLFFLGHQKWLRDCRGKVEGNQNHFQMSHPAVTMKTTCLTLELYFYYIIYFYNNVKNYCFWLNLSMTMQVQNNLKSLIMLIDCTCFCVLFFPLVHV